MLHYCADSEINCTKKVLSQIYVFVLVCCIQSFIYFSKYFTFTIFIDNLNPQNEYIEGKKTH